MAPLTWDVPGEKIFQTGVDRGVLYLPDRAVAWNGLVSIEESTNQSTNAYYVDGVKYLQTVSPGEFSAKLKAYTYPDEFDEVLGVVGSVLAGLHFHDQPNMTFGMAYRTRVGNDLEGSDYGYKIHVLYNMTAIPDASAYNSEAATVDALSFGWTITGIPVAVPGHRPTCHITFDSRETAPDILRDVENILYGTDTTDPHLPTLTELLASLGVLIIIDNGDGTFTIIDDGGTHIHMTDSTTFEVDDIDATYDMSGEEFTIHTTSG